MRRDGFRACLEVVVASLADAMMNVPGATQQPGQQGIPLASLWPLAPGVAGPGGLPGAAPLAPGATPPVATPGAPPPAMLNGMTPAAMMGDYQNQALNNSGYYQDSWNGQPPAKLSGTDELVAALIGQAGGNKDVALQNATDRFGNLAANPATRGWQDSFNRLNAAQLQSVPLGGNNGMLGRMFGGAPTNGAASNGGGGY